MGTELTRKRGGPRSCGCLARELAATRELRDLTGQRFGRLTVIELAPKPWRGASSDWLCRCDCGAETIGCSGSLVRGITRSCGCIRRERITAANTTHGLVGTAEYQSWSAMKARCTNSNDPAYPRYGGRGISVCDRWQKFENFLADMGPRPGGNAIPWSERTTLDRIDNDGNYEPGNCRWADWATQRTNKSRM